MAQTPASARLGCTAAQALQEHPTLAGLLQGHQQSQQWWAQVSRSIGPLAQQVRPGPIEQGCWTLLATHGSAAAKLRQWAPVLIEQLQSQGHPVHEVRVKVAATAPPAHSPK